MKKIITLPKPIMQYLPKPTNYSIFTFTTTNILKIIVILLYLPKPIIQYLSKPTNRAIFTKTNEQNNYNDAMFTKTNTKNQYQ
jgi:hypothetical protein